jgi:hypothetical protein
MTRPREKSNKETREKRFVETEKVASEMIEAEARSKKEKTERLRAIRLAAQQKSVPSKDDTTPD